ncbi:AAA family ATPase [Mucilaginibacter rubeus]|uniref:AAA family ATPase n=1 Tax=Mucilaginibacter rubeus TaxID=2027860 RepID=A0AAE6JF47_9SPHI|nr:MULTISPECIES: AAA domain-containing protein [Mucilaginibacter]QEM04421.1 AAA family ATPase [Mucilaginibacter rubeus]QEM17017.1 AAA family ATPase [Mucilaginibacter gossypii]QTE46487.1 AAA family ATPase [Mucilaginibacter rubeus]QTE53084.1 AAA family ATPase [Mucilaginibacter rubeus]QTE58171.1 AAA family ATPase [Mucilaginibacter rubeus]
MDYFKKLLSLLQTEQNEDRQAYLKLTETSSTAERRTAGLTWYPISIKGTEIGRGDYLTVEVERPSHQDLSHQFRFGASAALFSNHDPKTDRVNGTVSYQGGNRLKLTLNTDELPDWTRSGKLGIDLLFDDNSYDEMQKALKLSAKLIDDHKEGHLTRVLTGQSVPAFIPETIHYPLNGLNASQQQAVQKIIEAQELAIVHGPPGTGKTTTLVQAIKALIRQNKQQILVVAPSNTAVDLLSEKLSNEDLNVLRIGNPARVSERLMALTLDNRISAHSDMKEIKKLKKQASEYKNMAHKYKRNFGKAERDQRKALFEAAHQLIKEVDKTEQFITEDLLAKAQIITATLVGANHYTIRNLKFHTVVIDEAGQALEPACWIPISKAQKVIFAGDHLQLPPTIKSQQAGKDGLSTTLLEKCVTLHPGAVILLEEQYRMNEAIMGFSSKEFYGNRLKAHPTVAHQLLFPSDLPLSFVDTAGCGYDEKQEGTSTVNPEEAAFLFKHLHKLVSELTGSYSTENFPTIAVISPYKEQIRILNQLLLDSPELLIYADKIAVNTIDSFQGQERDVVYVSLTRSNTNGEIGFLNDIRRMNVAMTRARKKLVMIGDSSTLAYAPFYGDMISYAEQLNGYQSAWDYAGYD